MKFRYTAITQEGEERSGTVEAPNQDVATSALQNRGLVVSSLDTEEEEKSFLNFDFGGEITWFERVSNKEIVILSQQISTLFGAQVSALRVFRLLAQSNDNSLMSRTLTQVADDIQNGSSISAAMEKHPKVFSTFYVNMVSSAEESGKLNETFEYLADYLDRTYEIVSKTRNALIYPAFVIFVFISVLVLMLTFVIPQLTSVIVDSGQEPPIYTQAVIALSNFLVNYGLYLLIFLVAAGIVLWRYSDQLGISWNRILLAIPVVGDVFQKFYLSRIADNMHTMISSGIPMVRAISITGTVVGSEVYEEIIDDVENQVRGGNSVSNSLSQYDEIPNIMVQMIQVGEETGKLADILKTLATFYRREVDNTVDTMISLIEPAMIVALGLSVGLLLASVLMPIYNLSSSL